jgi:cation:H+ antiporter
LSLDYLYVAGGLLALFAGGEFLLRGAVDIARRLKMSELLIGLTIVGFGTSMPELLVSVEAAYAGKAGISIGNIVGSNIANVILIGAIAALILPITGWDRSVSRDALFMVVASFALLAAGWYGILSQPIAILFLAFLAIYLVITYRIQQQESRELAKAHEAPHYNPWIALVFLAAGFAMLFVGADYLVEGSTGIARDFGVSEAVIGLTIVAVGTSLPELATSAIAAVRGKSDIALGNIVGSNIFNILGILGITGLIAPIVIEPKFLQVDMPIMVLIAIGFAALLFFAKTIGRVLAVASLSAYGAYTWIQFA